MDTIGARLKFIQKNLGMTLPQLAQELGVSRETLISYQQNRTAPDSKILITIFQKHGVNPTWLLLGEGEPFLKEKNPEPQKPEEGKKPTKVVYFDDAVEILMETEKEMGVALTEGQRQIILKTMRRELAKARARDLIRAVKKEENQE